MKQKRSFGLVGVVFFAFAAMFFSGCFKEKNAMTPKEVTLEVWGVFDDSAVFNDIIKEYKSINPNVESIVYKKISQNAEEYEQELLDAFASGKGPDVVFFKNSWLPKHGNKINTLPNSEAQLSAFKNSFVDVAYQDFVKENQIYAMPLHNDTLALYYNKDLLNQAGISYPPKTWSEVRDQTKIITKIDRYGNIERSAIALGRSKDPGAINRSSDILTLMMMQGGSQMDNPRNHNAAFNTSDDGSSNPGLNALNFYTQFSRANSEVYTWNAKMDYSIDSFRYGRTAMMINYAYLKDRLKKMDPKLNFEIAPVPQLDLENKVNYGIYWGLAVTKNRELSEDAKYTQQDRIENAWHFIKYLTTAPASASSFDATKNYLELTGKAPARRDLVEQVKDDVFLGTFANQALTARTWHQPDDTAVEEIFVDMIDEVVSGQASAVNALNTAASRFNTITRD